VRAEDRFRLKSDQADNATTGNTYTDSAPGFDIVNVKVLCKDEDGAYSATGFQPLIADEVGVEAQIANIQMYVTYYVGTNVWGADNWPAGQTVTKPMVPVAENPLVYRTSPSNDIPVQRQDQVVQYRVWASYLGGDTFFKQQETFDNPSWYFPVDLNQTFAAQGWSPYYIVYGVPWGAVWINEINAVDQSEDSYGLYTWNNQYIEIAVPAGVELEGWMIDLVTGPHYQSNTIKIPAGLPSQEPMTNGYVFLSSATPIKIPLVLHCPR